MHPVNIAYHYRVWIHHLRDVANAIGEVVGPARTLDCLYANVVAF